MVISVLQYICTLGFIAGICKNRQSESQAREDAANQTLVKQWYWMYAQHIIGGLGMAVITFMAMKTDTENLARYNDELAKCHTDVQTKNK